MDEFEDRRLFVRGIRNALIAFGGDRYDGFADMRYVTDGESEYVVKGGKQLANITGDSLAAILIDIGRALS